VKRLVLAGGGHAHVEVLRALGAAPRTDVQLTLVSPYPWLTYSGMLPGYIAGHYALEDCTVDLAPLVARAGGTFLQTTATLVSAGARELVCSDGSVLPYDVLSLDVGSQPRLAGIEGVGQHATVVRPLEKLVAGWHELRERARGGGVKAVTLVGGGAAGVELAFAMDHGLRADLGDAAPHVRIISEASTVLPEWPLGARWRARRCLATRGIGVHVDGRVGEVGAGYVRLENGLEYASDAVFWTAGADAPDWLRDSGLATDPRGYVLTNDLLQSPSHPQVFAAGDCAVEQGHPVPRAGVFAVRAGPVLGHNLVAALEGRPLLAHIPKPRYLALLSTGERHAIGAWGPLSFSGRWAWRWKDRIDRTWMARYREPAAP
jgi:selenide,water dikinase